MKIRQMVLTSGSLLMLVTILIATSYSSWGAQVDEHKFKIITSPHEHLTALLTHDIDAGSVPYPEALDDLEDAGFTITTTTRLGQNLLLENNRVWPFGTENGNPDDPDYWRAILFRKAVHRLINKHECVALYAPLKSKAEWWLPPGQPYWINPDTRLPTFDPMAAIGYFDAGGFVQGTTPNPDYDAGLPWSAEYMRIDPLTGEDLNPIEYYAIGPTHDPIGFEMAKMIASWLYEAGIPVNLVAGLRLVMVRTLTNSINNDYQLMSGVDIFWGTVAPDILCDLTYSENLPLWNLVGMNITVADISCEHMMTTLDLSACKHAAYDIQTVLAEYEPYLPLLLDNGFSAFTGPYGEFDPEMYPETDGWEHPGAIGIVNAAGVGGLGYSASGALLSPKGQISMSNVWGKMLCRANRYDSIRPNVEINMWGLGSCLDTLNPLTADTEASWQILSSVEDTLLKRNPYTLDYMWWAAEDMPIIEEWVGPGRSQIGGNRVYDAPFNGTHYNGIPVADVTSDDLVGDDQVGMATTWTLRPSIYWHDSDPGPDMIWNTGDDGITHPVTAEDVRFGLDLMKYQDNVRYFSTWWYVHGVEVTGTYEYTIYEERRYPFAFEGHDVGLLTPKHIWEPWINPTIDVGAMAFTRPDGTTGYGNIWTGYENHHDFWFGYEEPYMEDPIYPGQWLTYLIGCGPFIYHLGGWEPDPGIHVESNIAYFAGCICIGDVNLDQFCDMDDLVIVMKAFGTWYGHPNYDPKADIGYPSQYIGRGIDLKEIYMVMFTHFGHWWGPGPVPPGYIRCPG